jgi:uncharacterized protein (UPF0335 family)
MGKSKENALGMTEMEMRAIKKSTIELYSELKDTESKYQIRRSIIRLWVREKEELEEERKV